MSIHQAAIEQFTGGIKSIDTDHAYIHAGRAFSISIDLGSISSAVQIALTTPAASTGKYVHFRPGSAGITTDADVVEYLFSGPITSYTGGAAYTPFNRNQNSANVSGCTVKTGVTPTVGSAVTLDCFSVGSTGIPGAKSGGVGGGGDEIVLVPGATYLFTLTPTGETNCYFNVFWYEEGRGV